MQRDTADDHDDDALGQNQATHDANHDHEHDHADGDAEQDTPPASADDEAGHGPREIRSDVADAIDGTHLGAAVLVEFPRDDNDLEELDFTTAMWLCDDEMSQTEVLAGATIMVDGLETLRDDAEMPSLVDDGSDEPTVETMPAPPELLEALTGGPTDGLDTDPDGKGFQ